MRMQPKRRVIATFPRRRVWGPSVLGVAAIVVAMAVAGCRPRDAGLGSTPTPPGAAEPRSLPVDPTHPAKPAATQSPSPPPLVFPEGVADSSTGCPVHMVRVATFCVDAYEAHLARVRDDAGIVPHPHYERPEEGAAYVAVSEAGTWPQAYVNRFEAQSACERAGKRLCTLSEWYRACVGPRQWAFSYGTKEQRGVCNTKKPHLLARFFGTDPYRWKYREQFNDPRLNQEPGFLAKTGEYAGCVSSEGVHDLVGNLHEWVSDSVDESVADKVPLQDNIHQRLGINRHHGIFMGGFYSTGSQHGEGCGFVTIGHGPTYHDYSTGFRCCRDLGRPASGDAKPRH